jgi:hypothetical protein
VNGGSNLVARLAVDARRFKKVQRQVRRKEKGQPFPEGPPPPTQHQ